MILEVIGILLIVVAVATVINIVEKIKEKNKSMISFREAMEFLELPLATFYSSDEKKLHFLLDTGSNRSYIDKSVLKGLTDYEILKGKGVEVMSAEGNKSKQEECSLTISYKGLKFEETFGVLDLSKSFNIIKEERGVTIHGILGSNFFAKYEYILDFKELVAYIG